MIGLMIIQSNGVPVVKKEGCVEQGGKHCLTKIRHNIVDNIYDIIAQYY
jgi:hypothetical protein